MLMKQLENVDRVTPETVQYVCQQIVQAIAPEKIVVFGSVARQESTESSDLDLLVVVSGSQDIGMCATKRDSGMEELIMDRSCRAQLLPGVTALASVRAS
jgi:predicted nucleotidyltransferase